VAVLGLFFLYLWARQRDVTRVKIGEIEETMNMAYVRVEGTVGRVTLIRDDRDRLEFLRFEVDDGTGTAHVKAYRHVASTLGKRNRLPKRGDFVTLAGSVRIAPEGQVSLFLQSADHVQCTGTEIQKVPLDRLDLSYLGKIIQIEGRLASVFEPREGSRAPYKLLLRGEDGSAMLVVWPRMWEALAKKGVREGAGVLARVTVGEHRGKLQLLLEDTGDLILESGRSSPAAHPPSLPEDHVFVPAEVDRSQLNRRIQVRGTVERITPPTEGSRPARIVLEGGGGTKELIAWEAVFEALMKAGLSQGTRVLGWVKVTEFKGKIQLTLQAGEDLTIEAKAPTEAETPEGVLSPAKVTRGLLGKIVEVRGIVESVVRYRYGTKVTVKEGEATLDIFMKPPVTRGLEGLEGLRGGARVWARGEVALYRQQLQITPNALGDFRIEKAGTGDATALSPPEKRSAASLTKADKGKTVILVGLLKSLRSIKNGSKAVLDDGSGKRITVVVWDRVKKKMKNPDDLKVGTRVRVVGKVSQYKEELQVVPEEGWDVTRVD
jgi:DNA/RNA endonuclease YhcR with UshA esterase domain